MTKDVLLELSKTLNTEYEIGVWSETKDFLKDKIISKIFLSSIMKVPIPADSAQRFV